MAARDPFSEEGRFRLGVTGFGKDFEGERCVIDMDAIMVELVRHSM